MGVIRIVVPSSVALLVTERSSAPKTLPCANNLRSCEKSRPVFG
jgi:hypothetical protein